MANFFSSNRRLLLLGGAVGVIAVVVGLRLSLGPSTTPRPAPTPPSPLERYFEFTVVTAGLDPIVVERERKVFAGTVSALRENPDFFEGWMTLASTKKQMGDFRGAAAIWEYAGQIRPLNSVSFNNLGDLYANFLNDYGKAEANFRTAIKNAAGEEKQQHYYVSLHELYRYRRQDSAQALAVLEEGVRVNDWSLLLQLKAAQYAATVGERAKALRYYQAALKLDPNNQQLAEEYRRFRAGR